MKIPSLLDLANPELYTTGVLIVQNIVHLVEAQKDGKSAEEKKKLAVELYNSTYKETDLLFDFPGFVDELATRLPSAIDEVIELNNKFQIFRKNKEVPGHA